MADLTWNTQLLLLAGCETGLACMQTFFFLNTGLPDVKNETQFLTSFNADSEDNHESLLPIVSSTSTILIKEKMRSRMEICPEQMEKKGACLGHWV